MAVRANTRGISGPVLHTQLTGSHFTYPSCLNLSRVTHVAIQLGHQKSCVSFLSGRCPQHPKSLFLTSKMESSWLRARRGRTGAASLPELAGAAASTKKRLVRDATDHNILHNDLAPSYGKVNQDRSDMIQPFTSIILHKTTDHSSASSTHRRRLTRVSPASRMPLANVCNKSGRLPKAWLKTCSWRKSFHGFSCSLSV